MNSEHRAIRSQLSAMAPKRAVAYIQSFDLPADEEYCLIAVDVRRMSSLQAANALHASIEYVKRCRARAYSKMADSIQNP